MAKAPATPHPGGTAGRMWLTGAVVAVVVVGGVLLANRGDDVGAPQIGHVHGLGINPADGQLYVAAHNDVFQLPAGGQAVRVGDGAQDTMGFTIVGPDRFLASPDGADWDDRSGIELADFAVSPTDPDLVLATTRDGIARSADGGRTWTPIGGPPVLLLAWDTDDRLWGVTGTGEVLRSAGGSAADESAGWSSAGTAPGAPSAFAAHGDDLYLAVPDEGIFHSGDGGIAWDQRYP